MINHYWQIFCLLVKTPFGHPDLVWGIVPLYFGWLLNELTSSKASFRTAIQTGFSFSWAGAHWLYQLQPHLRSHHPKALTQLLAINWAVTILVIAVGLTAFFSGIAKRFPPYCSFLGHSRFSNYFMIMIFPIQSGYLTWSWDYLEAIAVFALPIWFLMHFGLMPWRGK